MRAKRAELKKVRIENKVQVTEAQQVILQDAKWENKMEMRDVAGSWSGISTEVVGGNDGRMGRGQRKRGIVLSHEQLRNIAARRKKTRVSKSKQPLKKLSQKKKKQKKPRKSKF